MLYYKTVDNLGEVKDTVDFPPSGDKGFFSKSIYDERGFLKLEIKKL